MSNFSPLTPNSAIAEHISSVIISAFSESFVNSKLALIISAHTVDLSTKTALSASLLNASIPIAPEPLNKSKNEQPYKSGLIILKRDSLTRSAVGLVSIPSGALS